ncbi:hypothetical protein E4T63_24050 [Pseudomonas fluorescens]|uniref:Uncharacterized protein n=1 Tax=Pseudomonas fluorescens TaxID=294 RepID=A0AAP8Z1B9_PSEFL|nr:hypothetical protein E3Z29_27310 [Pseudomonas sp. S150]QBX43489.1 hypothetical protein E4T63_24050 [Pseudomonas fluorescens]
MSISGNLSRKKIKPGSGCDHSPVARGFIPDGLRSGPHTCKTRCIRYTELNGFTTAPQPIGDKSPHHRFSVTFE